MNTNTLKSFARDARKMFLSGVENRLSYWGFDLKTGQCTEKLEPIPGGYLFRGDIGDGERVPQLWQRLRQRVCDAQTARDIIEEASYSWFNRLMAMRILEKNGYLSPTLSFAEGSTIPLILQNARLGQHDIRSRVEQAQLQQYLQDDKDEQAFALLLRHLCNKNPLIQKVFGRLDDFTEILLPDNLLAKNGILQHINNATISDEDFQQVELIGWLYQFYIADRKDEVFAGFKKNQKARAEDIPAATQIFTPRWIVRYMVENTVGRIWLDQNPDSALKDGMKYLVDSAAPDPKGEQTNNQLTINNIQSLKLLDPACGSGHILVEGFELLFKMYDEEGFSKREAAKNILQYNLFGLDIDTRAAQLAQFAVLLKAAQLSDKSMLNADILPHIYAMPAPYDFSDNQMHTFLGDNPPPQYFDELKAALTTLQQGQNIGSALIVALSQAARAHIQARFDDLTSRPLSFMEESVLQRIKPFIEVLLVLSDRFEAVAANPPYMGSGTMNDTLKLYINQNYPLSKSDLFAVFMDVATHLLKPNARYGMINQHSWMFLSSFEGLRKQVLTTQHIENMLHLGPRTFDELSGEVVQSTVFVIENRVDEKRKGFYLRLVNYKNSNEKEEGFHQNKQYFTVLQSNFSKIPNHSIIYWFSDNIVNSFEKLPNLSEIFNTREGMATADNDRFLRIWSEVNFKNIGFSISNEHESLSCGRKWFPYNKGGTFRKWFGNNDYLVEYENNGFNIKNNIDPKTGRIRSHNYNGEFSFKEGLTWSSISSDSISLRYSPKGFLFDSKGAKGFTDSIEAVLAILNSKVADIYLKALSPSLDYKVGDVLKIPYSEKTIDNEILIDLVQQNITISRTDWNALETSWDFEKSPLLQSDNLRNAYAAWSAAATTAFWQLHQNEEHLNALFIGIYGLEDELTPSVSAGDVTILQSELDRGQALGDSKQGDALPMKKKEVMAQFLNYLLGCLMGRYRLDKTGLHIAHANATVEEIEPYTFFPLPSPDPKGEQSDSRQPTTNNQFEIDEDGIVPIMGKNSPFSDDIVMRLKTVLQQLWGEAAETDNLNFINECLEEPLEEWLTNPKKHWEWHKRQYHRKPIYWLFASSTGKDAAFKALVYQHRITRHTVGTLLNKYVLKHLQYLREESERLKNLDKSGKAAKDDLKLLQKFEKDIVECEKYVEVLRVCLKINCVKKEAIRA